VPAAVLLTDLGLRVARTPTCDGSTVQESTVRTGSTVLSRQDFSQNLASKLPVTPTCATPSTREYCEDREDCTSVLYTVLYINIAHEHSTRYFEIEV